MAPEDEEPEKPLTRRQRAFVHEYLKDLNATKAAIRAGYSSSTAHSSGPRLLENVGVKEAIDAAMERRAVACDVVAADILRELKRIALADAAQAVDESGKLLPLHEMPEDVRRSISSIETEELWEGRGEDRERLGDLVKVKFWDKKGALDLLGKHLGMFTEKHEHSGTVTLEHSGMTTDERRRAISKLKEEVAPPKSD